MTDERPAVDQAAIVPGAPAPPVRRRRGSRRLTGVYIALVPIFLILGAFQYYPALSGIFHSFFDWRPAAESTMIGWDNYAKMFADTIWWDSFRNLGLIFVFQVVTWAIPLFAAELLVSLRGRRAAFVYRTLLIVPMAFPGVVTALVWQFFYHPNNGVINRTLEAMGLGALAQNWVGDPDIAMLALLFVGFPFIAGLPFLIFYSTLQNIPSEVLEAAALDGVGRFARVWRIDLPMMVSQIKILFFLAIVGTLQYGFTAYVVTGGGPDNATVVPILRIINVAYQGQDWGYAAALSTTLFAITLVFSCIVVFARRRTPAEG
ncbi:carbohydrate ABC transporter permease [Microbacterium halophytorum]|uniref:carbohydrate ABC transporter permease n=1 Tax=Microbacterium halophytorum TaxID=2067568 RepID=UPI000CFB9AEB|nr:sugar ABC transporter permease [Microbacterium halophytorum]